MESLITKSVIACLIMLLFAAWNGVSIQWYLTKDQKYSKYFHSIGFALRGLLVLLFWGNWLVVLILLNLSWTAYDMIIAKFMHQDLFYIGKTSTWDKTFGYLGYAGKIILLLFTLYVTFI